MAYILDKKDKGRVKKKEKQCVKLHTWVGWWLRSGTNYTEKTKKPSL